MHRTYGRHKNLYISLFLLTIYLVLFTMVPCNSSIFSLWWMWKSMDVLELSIFSNIVPNVPSAYKRGPSTQ